MAPLSHVSGEDESPPPVAWVTGASSGIGEGAAIALAGAGFRVVLTARRKGRLEAVAARIADPDRVLVLPADVTDRHALTEVRDAFLKRWDRVDVLVNNAGVMPLSAMAKVRVEDWEHTVDVNVKGVLFAIAAVLPRMLAQESGHIVNVSSLASRRPFPNGAVYSATKSAVRALSAGLRLELSAATGIRVTDIEPGVVDTELIPKIGDGEAREAFVSYWRDREALRAEDVAEAILYAVRSPPHVNVNEILLRSTDQKT